MVIIAGVIFVYKLCKINKMETAKPLGKIDSTILCEYILQRGGRMSHLKLQKLLYYTEALHLAYFETSLIDDEFQAWLHGPVSRKIYNEIKDLSILHGEITYSPGEGPKPDEILNESLIQDQFDLINDVLNNYSTLSAGQLEDLTHREQPWIEARMGYGAGDRCEVIISKETMKSFYKDQVYGE